MKTKLLMAMLFIATTTIPVKTVADTMLITKPGAYCLPDEWIVGNGEPLGDGHIVQIVLELVKPEEVLLYFNFGAGSVSWDAPHGLIYNDTLCPPVPWAYLVLGDKGKVGMTPNYTSWPELWKNGEYWCRLRSSSDTLIHVPNVDDKIEVRVPEFFAGNGGSNALWYNTELVTYNETVYALAQSGSYELRTGDGHGLNPTNRKFFTLQYPVFHTITASAIEAGHLQEISLTPVGEITVMQGDDMTFTFQQEEVRRLFIDGVPEEVTGNTYTFWNVQQDHTFQVDYGARLSFSASAGEHGRIQPEGEVYDYASNNLEGFTFTFTFIPDEGYEVDKVTVDGAEVQTNGNTYFVAHQEYENVGVYKYIDVTFREMAPRYTITAMASGKNVPDNPGEYLTPYGDVQVTEGESQTFTFLRNPDSQTDVSRIWVNGTPTEVTGDTYTFNDIQQDCTFHVDYDYYYPYMATSGDNGTIDPQGYLRSWYSDSDSEGRTFTLIPDEDYEVDKVTVDGVEVQPNGNTCYVSHTGAENRGVVKDIRVTFREKSTSIVDNEGETHIRIHPNPVNDRLYLEGTGIESVQIYDMMGRQLINQTNTSSGIDVSGLKKGSYLIKIYARTHTVIQKILKP